MNTKNYIWTSNESVSEIKRLSTKGTLGQYSHIEVTEIIAFTSKTSSPVNLLTLVVAEEHPTEDIVTPHFLNPSRIQIPSLHEWRFGIYQYTLSINQLIPVFERLVISNSWDASGCLLHQNAQLARPPQFIPPDSFQKVPLNRVLKNNFWNGSYVIEWENTKKTDLSALCATPSILQNISEAIHQYIPVNIASLSDRLGNILLQLPITVLMAKFSSLQNDSLMVEVGWHPYVQPRTLRASVEREFDETITGYHSALISGEQTLLPMPPGPGSYRTSLWDEANSLILAATGPISFIKKIAFSTRPIDPEPRIFTLLDAEGHPQSKRVRIHSTLKNIIYGSENDENEGWTRRRMYREDTSRLVQERRFVQYRPQQGQQTAEHEKALGDIRHLIIQHGDEGTWLWDPYLSALDIIKTLFFSPHGGADLRGLTAREEYCNTSQSTNEGDFIQRQKDAFAHTKSNFLGMKLEFRAKTGTHGWNFHDRFLIFPKNESSALVWSLGTSINSVGKAHHIMQRVDDGQQVMDAFVELWNQLDGPEHLIWKV